MSGAEGLCDDDGGVVAGLSMWWDGGGERGCICDGDVQSDRLDLGFALSPR